MKSSCKKPSSNSAIEAPMDGSGDNPQILQIPVHLPGYTQCFTRILPAFYLDISSVLPGYYQRVTWILPAFYPDIPSVWPKYGLPSKPFKPVN